MKLLLKIVSMILVVTLAIPTLPAKASAINPIDLQTIDLGNGLEISFEESSEKRITIYYENNIPKQKAILFKESGDIYYYDLSLQNDFSRNYSMNDNISLQSYTKKYNIEDFKVVDDHIVDKPLIAKSSSASYTLLKSKIYDDLGQTYKRYLYGYKGEKQYDNNSWHFVAGTAVSVIATVFSFIPHKLTDILSKVGSVAGVIIGALAVKEKIKELFWVYKFNQTNPNILEFVCRGNYTYEKQRLIEVNGNTAIWETFYTEPAWSIESLRNDILTNPGYYM